MVAMMPVVIPKRKSRSGQFAICLAGSEPLFSSSLQIGEWVLSYDTLASVHRVFDKSGYLVGAFVGVLIDYAQEIVVTSDITLTVSEDDERFIETIEAQIYRYAGSWLFLLATDAQQRIYLDPCGSHSLVYEPTRKIAASTVGLILDDVEYQERFDRVLHDAMEINKTGWFPAGLTAHHNVKRLVANHYLDLVTWGGRRHWPLCDFEAKRPVAEVGPHIARLISATLKALKNNGRVALAITGGKDSRLLLSACREFISEIDLLTIDLPGSEKDVYLAKALTDLDNTMQHAVLPPVRADEEQRTAWLYNASHCVGGVNQYYSGSLAPILGNKYFISGAAGEIGRAYLWRDGDNSNTALSAKGLIGRLGLKHHERIEAAITSWLGEVKNFDLYTILDLAYAELRVSSWAFVQSYAYAGKGRITQISPFSNRELISLLFSLPPADRRSEAYVYTGIEAMWPDLLKVGFNKYGDFRDALQFVRRAINPGRLAHKLRSLLAPM